MSIRTKQFEIAGNTLGRYIVYLHPAKLKKSGLLTRYNRMFFGQDNDLINLVLY